MKWRDWTSTVVQWVEHAFSVGQRNCLNKSSHKIENRKRYRDRDQSTSIEVNTSMLHSTLYGQKSNSRVLEVGDEMKQPEWWTWEDLMDTQCVLQKENITVYLYTARILSVRKETHTHWGQRTSLECVYLPNSHRLSSQIIVHSKRDVLLNTHIHRAQTRPFGMRLVHCSVLTFTWQTRICSVISLEWQLWPGLWPDGTNLFRHFYQSTLLPLYPEPGLYGAIYCFSGIFCLFV